MRPHSSINKLIAQLKLEPHPEGGYFKKTYTSDDQMKIPEHYEGTSRPSSTHIYYLLPGKEFSAWHRLRSDENWHFYAGKPLHIFIIDQQSHQLKTITLGNPLTDPDALFQYCVAKDQWFAAQPVVEGGFSLVGCTVSPGFDYRDWELANREELLKQFPQHKEIILKLSRPAINQQQALNGSDPNQLTCKL